MLPTTVKSNEKDHSPHKYSTFRDILFKSYVISLMTIVWSAHALLLRYTRIQTGIPMYYSTTVVLSSEICKFVIASLLLFREHKFHLSSTVTEVRENFIGKPMELLKMSVPSIVYALQNNLDFIALANLEPGVYQVTCQLKVVTTAIFMVLMLGRRYSPTRWFSIVLLFGGVALVQLNAVESTSNIPSVGADVISSSVTAVTVERQQNYLVGLSAVLTTCLTAGFAGVYFEKMLKDNTTTLWIRNMQMYFTGMISAGLACLIKEGWGVFENGFFYGYYDLVYVIIGLLSVGGIYISMVMKYLDNLLKSFASAVSISFVSLLSAYIFGTSLGFYFIIGSATVMGAILLYNYVKE